MSSSRPPGLWLDSYESAGRVAGAAGGAVFRISSCVTGVSVCVGPARCTHRGIDWEGYLEMTHRILCVWNFLVCTLDSKAVSEGTSAQRHELTTLAVPATSRRAVGCLSSTFSSTVLHQDRSQTQGSGLQAKRTLDSYSLDFDRLC